MKSNVIVLKLSGGGAMTGAAVINSDPLPVDQIYGFAIQANYSGTPVGTLKLQASCDAPGRQQQTSNGGPYVVTNWVDVANSSQAVSGSGSFIWNFNGSFYNFVRLVYTNTSGTGTLTANICEKG